MRHFRRMIVFLWKAKVESLIVETLTITVGLHLVYWAILLQHLFKCFEHVECIVIGIS